MYAEKIKTKSAQPGFVYIAVIEDASEMEHNTGMCLACGAENGPVEPDARKYKCENCGECQVYGLEELLIMGRLKIGGNRDGS